MKNFVICFLRGSNGYIKNNRFSEDRFYRLKVLTGKQKLLSNHEVFKNKVTESCC